jgi:hypothetical protein
MAKKGIMYFVTLGFGGGIVAYLFWANRHNLKKSREFKDVEDMYKHFEGKKKLVTTNELRLMSERNKVDEVPVSDDKNGYM